VPHSTGAARLTGSFAAQSGLVQGRRKPPMASEAVDGAARYLLYKLFDATAGRPDAWQVLGNTEERLETVARAAERGLDHHPG
jgi:hypothetical protein